MATYHYADPPGYQYATAPAPPPPEASYVVPPPPPASAFSPVGHHDYYPTPSPLVVAASPAPSVGHHSRSSSRGAYISGERAYLAPGGYNGALSRSNSGRERDRDRGRDRGQIVVEGPPRHRSQPRSAAGGSEKVYYDTRPKKYYIDDHDDNYSNYSGSSYGPDSRERSRSVSRARPTAAGAGRHTRTPSNASGDSSYDDRYAVGVYRPSRQEEELTEKLKEVQKQLEKVQVDAEKKRMLDEEKRLEKLRTEEIERKVQEQIRAQRQKEEEAARRKQAELEAEKRRIAEAAKKLLEEQAAAAKKAKEEDDKKKAEISAIVEAERRKYDAAQAGKKTYTRFSKTHLCKEALEERNIPFTEERDYFLVHRFVEKTEQQYLWNRTKEIRNYYQQIQEAAEKAPTVAGPNGGYVKYVQIAGQPYPMALPVTITQTPGGGQTQRVDPIKIKWSDIFKV